MNRTRLAQLTAVLGAAVLLVLAVAVTRTDRTTVVAGPALDQVTTQGPLTGDTPAPLEGDADAADGAGGDEPVVGPTATDPVVGPTATGPAAPGDGGGATEAPDAVEPTETVEPTNGLPGVPGAPDPAGSARPAPRESRDPFASGSSTAADPESTTPAPTATAATAPGATSEAPGPVPTGSAAEPPPDTTPTTAATTAPPPGATQTPPAATPPPASAPSAPATAGGPPHPAPPPEATPGSAKDHVVVHGDSLWEIAASTLGPGAGTGEIAGLVAEVYQLNRDVIGSDPDLILPGQQLQLPSG